VYQGLMVTVLTFVAYMIGHLLEGGAFEFVDSPDGMTMAFLTMSMAEIFHSFNMRTVRKSIFSLKNQNRYLIGAMVLSLILTTAVIYIPGLNSAFGFTSISFVEYAVAMGLALTVIPIVEFVKLIQRAAMKNKNK
ncbi:MAG: cation transporting ATPase C-terminal domain-containing protein, partial [Clostridia bacterium]|nr:cation transporting ATPase C-terminal domain-containing protein [Clostridia bacterium]